jgi:hypothetical protein
MGFGDFFRAEVGAGGKEKSKSARDGPRPLHWEAQAGEWPSEAHDEATLTAKRFP